MVWAAYQYSYWAWWCCCKDGSAGGEPVRIGTISGVAVPAFEPQEYAVDGSLSKEMALASTVFYGVPQEYGIQANLGKHKALSSTVIYTPFP